MDNNGDTKFAASFPKNNRELVCVGTNEYKGRNYVFIRIFVPGFDEGEIVATKSGISLPIEKYGELLQGINELGKNISSDKVAARIQKNSSQQIWIGRNTYNNIPLIYVRTYSKYDNSVEYKPTKKGISIRVDTYPKLLGAVEKISKAETNKMTSSDVGNPPVKCPFCEEKMEGRSLHKHINQTHVDNTKSSTPMKDLNFNPGRRYYINEHGNIIFLIKRKR